MSTKEPLLVLVKTWIDLALSSEDREVKLRAQNMLLDSFGDMAAVVVYAQKHQIKLRK